MCWYVTKYWFSIESRNTQRTDSLECDETQYYVSIHEGKIYRNTWFALFVSRLSTSNHPSFTALRSRGYDQEDTNSQGRRNWWEDKSLCNVTALLGARTWPGNLFREWPESWSSTATESRCGPRWTRRRPTLIRRCSLGSRMRHDRQSGRRQNNFKSWNQSIQNFCRFIETSSLLDIHYGVVQQGFGPSERHLLH